MARDASVSVSPSLQPAAKRQRPAPKRLGHDHRGAVAATAAATSSAIESPSPRRPRHRRLAAAKAAVTTAAMAIQDNASGAVPDRCQLYERLFAPITDEERQEWQGWTDIESEPAFFNFILDELGIREAVVQELFSVDEESIACLEDPLGLIFLYKFVEEDENEPCEDCPDTLWFANQTTSNACGTIAMLNIAMNCPTLRLGDHLTQFRAATQDLHPALRGHLLSTDTIIRATHNSFVRRLDMLTADVHLRREWEDGSQAAKKRARAAARKQNGRVRKSRKTSQDDAAFHFIAYVPLGEHVWELNGIREKPLRIGSFSGDWTSLARERIAARMEAYAQNDETAVFSLLALCRRAALDAPDTSDTANATGLIEDIRRAAARKGDYTPAIHSWLTKLADKGVLRQLATGEPDEPLEL